MPSLYGELSEKLEKDPRLTRRGGPRIDLSILLFNARADISALWAAADRLGEEPDDEARAALGAAVEALRPVFGERSD